MHCLTPFLQTSFNLSNKSAIEHFSKVQSASNSISELAGLAELKQQFRQSVHGLDRGIFGVQVSMFVV
jgi:hypothetical protein